MFCSSDYDGVTYESEEATRRERAALQAQEDDERTDREMAFIETPYCSSDCFDDSEHTAHCRGLSLGNIAQPIAFALAGWLNAMKEAA